jgi:hypothetical protein
MCFKYVFVVFLLWSASVFLIKGQNGENRTLTFRDTVFFRIGESRLDLSYMNNRKSLENVTSRIERVIKDSGLIVSGMKVQGGFSIDGKSLDRNLYLAKSRALEIKSYVAQKLNIIDSQIEATQTENPIEDVKSLIRTVNEPWKNKVLTLIEDEKDVTKLKKRLMSFEDGVAYRYMLSKLFPSARNVSSISVTFSRKRLETDNLPNGMDRIWPHLCYLVRTSSISDRDSIEAILQKPLSRYKRIDSLINMDNGKTFRLLHHLFLPALVYDFGDGVLKADSLARLVGRLTDQTPVEYRDELFLRLLDVGSDEQIAGLLASLSQATPPDVISSQVISSPSDMTVKDRDSKWALKNNTLYDLLCIPNLEIEYRLNKRWSINLEGQYAWWSDSKKNRFYQIASGGSEIRYWIKSKESFSGHYVGVFYGCGLYDLENGKEGYQGEYAVSTGLSYGYMKPLGRRLSLEFGLGLGYLSTEYDKYLPIDGRYVYQSTSHLDYLGLIKSKISIVWKLRKTPKK